MDAGLDAEVQHTNGQYSLACTMSSGTNSSRLHGGMRALHRSVDIISNIPAIAEHNTLRAFVLKYTLRRRRLVHSYLRDETPAVIQGDQKAAAFDEALADRLDVFYNCD